MKIILPLAIAALIYHTPAYAKSNFERGYIVNLEGDTIYGFIEYQHWERNPLKISFKEKESDTPREFFPISIRSFSVKNELYESAVVDVDTSPYKEEYLNQSSVPEYERDTVFLQSIVRGTKQLYYLNDQKRKEHFYIEDNGFKPLVHKRYIVYIWEANSSVSRKMIAENNGYKAQLNDYLSDCPGIEKKVANTRYEKSSLVKLFTDYYECVGKDGGSVYDSKDIKLEFGFLAGVSNSNISFSDGARYALKSSEFETSTKVTLGAYLDLRLLQTKRLGISNDLYYSSFDISGVGYWSNPSVDSVISSFNYQLIKSNNQLRFYLTKTGSLYLGFGVSIAVPIKTDVRITVQNPSQTELSFRTESYSFGYVGTLGFQFRKLSAEVRGENNFVGNGEYGKIQYLHFFLKYRLN